MRLFLLFIIIPLIIFAAPVELKKTIDNGGGIATDGVNDNEASIGQAITGRAQSDEYADYAGYITATAHITLAIESDKIVSKEAGVIIYQNEPNPFNDRTRIEFYLFDQKDISLEVMNLRGQKVFEFTQGNVPPGNHSVLFEAGNLPDGIYMYKIKVGKFEIQKKMTLIN